MDKNQQLVVKVEKSFRHKLSSIFQYYETNPDRRLDFIENPAAIFASILPNKGKHSYVENTLVNANRLIYYILTSKHFITWAEDYQQKIATSITTNTTKVVPAEMLSNFKRDVTDAFIRSFNIADLAKIFGYTGTVNDNMIEVVKQHILESNAVAGCVDLSLGSTDNTWIWFLAYVVVVVALFVVDCSPITSPVNGLGWETSDWLATPLLQTADTSSYRLEELFLRLAETVNQHS